MIDAIAFSLVIPEYNEAAALPLFYEKISVALAALDLPATGVEILFVDDGSSDAATAQVLRELAAKDSRVRYVIFSRNFGKEAAILAGLREARGRIVALLDADGQHPADLLPEMFAAVKTGEIDCVAGKRNRAGDSRRSIFWASQFYRVMSRLTELEIIDGVGDFRVMNRAYVNAVLSLPERRRFSKGIFPWVGFRIKYVEYENQPRIAGQTKWSFSQLLIYALDGISGFSSRLLTLISLAGLGAFSLSLLMFAVFIAMKIMGKAPVDGITTILCALTFLGSVLLLSMGAIGHYLAKIYDEVKARPAYIIREKSPPPARD